VRRVAELGSLGVTGVMRIRVVKTPPGEAPESVRQAWVGLTLEALGRRPIRAETVGVVSKPRTRFGLLVARLLGRTRLEHGYVIDAAHAIEVLNNHAPDAGTVVQRVKLEYCICIFYGLTSKPGMKRKIR